MKWVAVGNRTFLAAAPGTQAEMEGCEKRRSVMLFCDIWARHQW